LAQEVDVIDEKTQAALSQIGREEKAAAADKVSPIVRHRVSVAEDDGFRYAQPILRAENIFLTSDPCLVLTTTLSERKPSNKMFLVMLKGRPKRSHLPGREINRLR
jgi:hypothetical protein